ncbi:MAG: GtrA family protein [Steroidobacteraceae bacterium]
MRRAGSFVIAGAVGFLVDATVLHVLVRYVGAGLYIGRAGSFLSASYVTWLINRHFTFRAADSGQSMLAEWWRYLSSSLVGGCVNYGVYALLASRFGIVREHLYIGVACGSLAGMLLNFCLYSAFVFRRADRSQN